MIWLVLSVIWHFTVTPLTISIYRKNHRPKMRWLDAEIWDFVVFVFCIFAPISYAVAGVGFLWYCIYKQIYKLDVQINVERKGAK